MPPTPAPASALLPELLAFVRTHSPFYRDYWAQVPAASTRLADYPLLDSKRFWAANTVQDNRVFTGPLDGGITFKSGGTTGQPKYSVFTNSEWQAFTRRSGERLRLLLRPGDRVGNLFYAGKLYASFLFSQRLIEAADMGMGFPIAGDDLHEALAIWRQFDLNVLAGVPTTLMKLLELLTPEDRGRLSLRLILFAGEPMFADQIARVQAVFPGCVVRSISVAGVDYGELGWTDPEAEPGVHHSYDDSTVLEIIDEGSDASIEEAGVPGRLVVTNLLRRLMPIVRYPVGDRGEWVDPPGTPERRFRLLGRTEEGARVGPMTLYVDDIRQALTALQAQGVLAGFKDFQLLISHHGERDECCLRLALAEPAGLDDACAAQIAQALYAARPMFRDLLDAGVVHPLRVHAVTLDGLQTNARSGKLLRVLDQRHG
ncbi:phenylacetate--CoA ligase family protein [Comamonas sp. NLF-1-9]|uniref:phenylacetate--CoA ligase family protein n=1 Tax=Comamonas sp. NLF-1-9 TaxID=2853163 RepID=UPI001C48A448|nr:hypothetical protein [Comamonas sp. NLF-1-9]QXL85421.1 hypothetical protein KUD94_05510 [Comamonas sp. NLF-1-9]